MLIFFKELSYNFFIISIKTMSIFINLYNESCILNKIIKLTNHL